MSALPPGPFNVIYADPPWRFESWSTDGEGRSATQHYDCMNLDAIAALPVSDIAAKDAALFLWVIQPMLPEALKLIEAWGFTYKTVAFGWVKIKGEPRQQFLFADSGSVRKGMGYHTRAGMEQCWLATRGRGYERLTKGEAQVHLEGLREHSRKPDHFADAITRLTGDVPRLEMFARTTRPRWSVWGNQVDKFGEVA
ncbi:MAG: adenine methyltransferase [Hoeflea sp.]|nr:adenine methyltransferase [Hoeflea sp.]